MKFADYPWPIKTGARPYQHQIDTVKFILLNPRGFVLNDMGTGKTLSALWAADFLMMNDAIKKALIVGPLSTLTSTWVRDIAFNLPHRRYAVVHGTRDRRIEALNSDADFFIINHDGITIMENEIIKAGFPLVIIDELTAFKNFQANRTKAMYRVARTCRGVVGMTGAPTPNGPEEAYGQAKVVNPANPYLPPYYTQYRDRVLERINTYIYVPKPGAEKIVHQILQPAIRFKREDCVDLPPATYEVREIPLTAEQSTAYHTMRKELLVEHQNGIITAANAAVKMSKLLQIAAGGVKDSEGNVVEYDCSNRLEELYDIFLNTPQKKLVVFTAFRASIGIIERYFRSKKVSVASIYGDVDQKDRATFISAFQGGQLEVLIIQPQAASHGITLTAANTIVWFSLLASNEVHDQANHRIIRIGQTRGQLIIYFIGCKAERHVKRIIDSKENFAESVVELFEDILEGD